MTQQPIPEGPDDHLSDRAGTEIERAMPSETKTPLYQANHAARYHRQEIIKQIEDRTGRPLICYVSDIRCGIDQDDTIPFGDLLHNLPRGENMELLLHTPGVAVTPPRS